MIMIEKPFLLLLLITTGFCSSLQAQDSLHVKWGTIRIGKKAEVETAKAVIEKEVLELNSESFNIFEMPLQIGGPVFSQLYAPIATPKVGKYVLFDFVVTQAGKVDGIRFYESYNDFYEQKTSRMLKRTKWRPATKGTVQHDYRFPIQIVYYED